MISNAFKSAYTNQVSQQNQGINTITAGIKDAGTAIAGVMGFAGALGSGALATASKHALAGRIGGVGGNLMVSTMQQKATTAKLEQYQNSIFNEADNAKVDATFDKVAGSMQGATASEFKALDTVWSKIENARQLAKMESRVNEAYKEVQSGTNN